MDYSSLLSLLEQTDAYGNTVRRWLLAAVVAALSALAMFLLLQKLKRRAEAWRQRTDRPWLGVTARLLGGAKPWFLLATAAYFGSLVVVLPANAAAVVTSIAVIALLLQAALWGDAMVHYAIARHADKHLATDAASVTLMSALGFIARMTMWTVAALLALENLGVNITALVAGLGIGGVAVALAAQNVLGDLFASLSIVLDRPFVLGDYIVVGQDMGEVEHIGMKTTRVRTPAGDQLIFSNADLLKSRIRNCKRMTERRVVFPLGVASNTPPEVLAAIPDLLRKAIEGRPQTRFDRAHLKEISAGAIVFETAFAVASSDHALYLGLQQEINLAILRSLAELGVSLAHPRQIIVLESPPGRWLSDAHSH